MSEENTNNTESGTLKNNASSINDEFISRSQVVELLLQQINVKNEFFKDSFERTVDIAKSSKVVIEDEYSNSLTSTGTKDKTEQFTKYNFSNETLNWCLWLALYNDSWVFKRAIDKPALDMVRCGISLQNQTDVNKAVLKTLQKHRSDFIELLMWGALFGGAVAVIMFDNLSDEDYSKPINYEKIKDSSSIKMYITDRWYGCSPTYDNLVTNMNDFDYGKPKFYDISFSDGHNLKVHHDYILRCEGRLAPALIKRGHLQGWGYAEGAHLLNELSRDEKLKTSIQSLVDKSLIEVIKMDGMRGIFMGADKDNENQLRKRLEMVNWGRNFNSLTFLDRSDEYQQNQFSGLTGLSDLLEKNMWLISAALEMQGVLFGDLKQGFSNDTDALERYDETINARCEMILRPIYTKFLSILFKLYSDSDKDIVPEFEFDSLLSDRQDQKKTDALNRFTELASKLLIDGVINTAKYAKALQNYTKKGIIDFEIDDDYIDELKQQAEEENELFDLNETQVRRVGNVVSEVTSKFDENDKVETGKNNLSVGTGIANLSQGIKRNERNKKR